MFIEHDDMTMRMIFKYKNKDWKKILKCMLNMSMRTRAECKDYKPGTCKEWGYKYQTCVSQAVIWAMNGKWDKLRENRQKFLDVSGKLLEMEMDKAMETDDHVIRICGELVKGEEAIRRIGISMKGDYEVYAEWCDVYEDL